jgi:arylsulfatase
MSDDMGYSDIGCYGGEIETPRLDQLAANGIRFTQFYNMARCCPTRASLLTGLYPHQAGVGHMMEDKGYDGYRGELNRHCVTMAEVLKTAGYRTYMAGKWHVTKAVDAKSLEEKHNWPLQRGFDRFYGTIHGAGSFFDPNSLTRDNTLISPFADPEYTSERGFYYTDAIADHASRFIQEHAEQHAREPFFMYVSFTAAHWPMHAREEDIAKYQGRYDAGYEAIRQARYQRMLELGIVNAASTTLWPMEEEWKETEFLEWDTRNMEVYAAMIDCMDRGVGHIVDRLAQLEQLDNTLILFFQDNGGCAEAYGRGKSDGPRAEQPPLAPLADDYLQPDMQPKQTRDGYPVRTGKGVMAGPADTYIGYGRGWATVSNTPFREYKHWTHEGGISTPLIAHWPQRITRQGELEHTPSHLIDLMATAVDVAGATYPTHFHGGEAIQPMEGKSLVPAFDGRPIEREAIYWEHEGNRAVRQGDYKLVAKGAEGKWELYDIAHDRSEQQDLSNQFPELVARMEKLWNEYAERAHVLPLVPGRNAKEKFKRNKFEFQLAQGDTLSRNEAPFVEGRGFSLQVELEGVGDGTIAAQGGITDGWSVYVQEGLLSFATTHAGRRSIIRSATTVSGAQWRDQTVLERNPDGYWTRGRTFVATARRWFGNWLGRRR